MSSERLARREFPRHDALLVTSMSQTITIRFARYFNPMQLALVLNQVEDIRLIERLRPYVTRLDAGRFVFVVMRGSKQALWTSSLASLDAAEELALMQMGGACRKRVAP